MGEYALPKSEGKEGIDRTTDHAGNGPRKPCPAGLCRESQNISSVLISSFPYAINWEKDSIPAIVHMPHLAARKPGAPLPTVLFATQSRGQAHQTWYSSLTPIAE